MATNPNNGGYHANPNLPKEGYIHQYTQQELDEYKKCMDDPVYFSRNYIKIVTLDNGLTNFDMYPFQENMINTFHNNRFTICKLPRQVGKTTTAVAYLLHFLLFNEFGRVAILANKASTAREIMSRLQLAFEYLPRFLQQGVVEWNKGSIQFSNGSLAIADATSGASVRGKTFNILFLDEFAHVPNGIAKAFFDSTYPTISSGKNTKVIIVSTPLGLNLFHSIWKKAVEKENSYIPIEINWWDVPGRDEVWKKETIENTSEEQFRQEFNTEFIGSTNTLISAAKLISMRAITPVETREDEDEHGKKAMHIFNLPEPDHVYAIIVDVSEGLGLDYSTFSIFDVSKIPYVQVARYQSNKMNTMVFPTVIYAYANMYNEAFVLVEINTIGLQVADTLHNDLEYAGLLKIQRGGRNGQEVSSGFKTAIQNGLKTSVQTKRIGCANLKTLIENDKLIVQDEDTILELQTFTQTKQTFAAEEGNHDDLAMTLVNFAWLAAQKMFKQSVNNDIRKALQDEQYRIEDINIVPFGIIDDGLQDEFLVDVDGDIWKEDIKRRYPFDDFNWGPTL